MRPPTLPRYKPGHRISNIKDVDAGRERGFLSLGRPAVSRRHKEGTVAVKVAVIYYSATGTTYGLARAIEEGAGGAGAEVRLRKVKELAPEQAIASNEGWAENVRATQDVQEATLDDLT